MKAAYLEALALVERLHRHFLEVVKVEMDRLGVRDINNVQALILYNIGNEELTVGELTQRGYYLGSNISYNLKKLIEQGYIAQARTPHDRRSVRIKLTQKGLDLHRRLDGVFQKPLDPARSYNGRFDRQRGRNLSGRIPASNRAAKKNGDSKSNV